MDPNQKKLGFGFWIIVVLAIIKDSLDIFNTLLGGVLEASVAIPLFNLIAVPMGVILDFSTGVFGMFFAGVAGLYFFLVGVKPSTNQIFAVVGAWLIEMVPFLDVLPMETISLVAFYFFYKSSSQKASAEAAANDEEYGPKEEKSTLKNPSRE